MNIIKWSQSSRIQHIIFPEGEISNKSLFAEPPTARTLRCCFSCCTTNTGKESRCPFRAFIHTVHIAQDAQNVDTLQKSRSNCLFIAKRLFLWIIKKKFIRVSKTRFYNDTISRILERTMRFVGFKFGMKFCGYLVQRAANNKLRMCHRVKVKAKVISQERNIFEVR